MSESEKDFKVVDRRLKFEEGEGEEEAAKEAPEEVAPEEVIPEEEAAKESGKTASKGPEEPSGESETCPPLPKVSFSTFVLSLSSSALVHLGEVPEPGTGKSCLDMAMAKHTIDILAMLQDKAKNGLDQDETRLLEGLLYELRMKYVMKKK